MKPRIIIPAAGEAVRFGGLPKELLPISETDCSLTRAVRVAERLGGEPVIMSNPMKEFFHHAALQRAKLECEVVVRNNYQHKDLWGSIERGLEPGRAGGLLLADTVSDGVIILPGAQCKLTFGYFHTSEPSRFSILLPDRIATKEDKPPGNQAWGMVFWDGDVTDFLLAQEVTHYDRAFELAIKQFATRLFKLNYYFDLGTFKAYKDFLAI